MTKEYIHKLLHRVHFSYDEKEIDKVINELVNVPDDEIVHLIVYKSEIAGKALKKIGYPRVKDVMPQLLEWLQDANWPGSLHIAELFVSIGEHAIPFLKDVLKGNDNIWKYWVMEFIISKFPREIIELLLVELKRIASDVDIWEYTDIQSMKILVNNEFEEGKTILNIKSNRLTDYLREFDELKKSI